MTEEITKTIPDISMIEVERRGALLAEVLMLPKERGFSGHQTRYATMWGSKTAVGLYLTTRRIIETGI